MDNMNLFIRNLSIAQLYTNQTGLQTFGVCGTKNFPAVEWRIYISEGDFHCKTEQQAQSLRNNLSSPPYPSITGGLFS
jgi:hypothetical protein